MLYCEHNFIWSILIRLTDLWHKGFTLSAQPISSILTGNVSTCVRNSSDHYSYTHTSRWISISPVLGYLSKFTPCQRITKEKAVLMRYFNVSSFFTWALRIALVKQNQKDHFHGSFLQDMGSNKCKKCQKDQINIHIGFPYITWNKWYFLKNS